MTAKRASPSKSKNTLFYLIPLGIVLVMVAMALSPIDGMVGHDYSHVIPRLHIGMLFFHQNGFKIPHYTPSLCGGEPFFADPQSYYYSLTQWLAFFVDAFLACQITWIFFYGLGYWGMYELLRKVFRTNVPVSHLGALMFVLNGFSFEHAFVGHTTHHSFLLAPWLIYHLLRRITFSAIPVLKRSSSIALLMSYIWYSGGMHVMFVFSVMTLIIIPFVVSRFRKLREVWEEAAVWVLSALMIVLCCGGKLAAAIAYSRRFFSAPIDFSSDSILIQFFRYFWFLPGATPNHLPFGRLNMGCWEYVGFVTKLVLPLACVFAWHTFRQGAHYRRLIGFYALFIPLVIVICSGQYNEAIPFVSSYHLPIKLLSSMIVFMALLSALALQAMSKKWKLEKSPWGFCIIAAFLIVEFSTCVNYFTSKHIGIAYPYLGVVDDNLRKSYKLPEVTMVTDAAGDDDQMIGDGRTSLQCYEPLFGYRGESMNSQTIPGAVWIKRFGRFNLNHPGCLVYPEFFHCEPWDLIKTEDQSNLELFITGYAPRWQLPRWQEIWINVSLLALLVCAILCWTPSRTLNNLSLFFRNLGESKAQQRH
jgi:hypothetical protein